MNSQFDICFDKCMGVLKIWARTQLTNFNHIFLLSYHLSIIEVVIQMDPTFPLAPVANFLSFFLVCIPLFSTPILSGPWDIFVFIFSLSTELSCLKTGINAIIYILSTLPPWVTYVGTCDATHSLDLDQMVPRRSLGTTIYSTERCCRGTYVVCFSQHWCWRMD